MSSKLLIPQLAYVLHSRPYRETSALVDFITLSCRLKSNFGAVAS